MSLKARHTHVGIDPKQFPHLVDPATVVPGAMRKSFLMSLLRKVVGAFRRKDGVAEVPYDEMYGQARGTAVASSLCQAAQSWQNALHLLKISPLLV